jgi:streptomycin 6-kinase
MVRKADELNLPDGYAEGVPRSWRPWLDRLPHLVAECIDRWELTVVGQFPLSSSYVVPVVRADGRSCVLKIQPTGVPGVEGAERELLGLRLGAPHAVGVVDDDVSNGVLLLDRVVPGTSLDEVGLDDDAATQALALVIRDYGRPTDAPESQGLRAFEELADAFRRFDRGPYGSEMRNADLVTPGTREPFVPGVGERQAIQALRSARDVAERVLDDLLADPRVPHLLHGDLHHGNVLTDEERGLVVIDPWGLYGDRSVDVAPALENPLEVVAETPDVDALIRRRLAIYAEVLEVDKDQLAAWCFAYCVIRELWALEDSGSLVGKDRTIAALRHLI